MQRPESNRRAVRFTEPALRESIEIKSIEGVKLHVTSITRTIADCFKFRNKIGLDVALEALREVRKEERATIDDLWLYAKLCRVARAMRPYPEAIS